MLKRIALFVSVLLLSHLALADGDQLLTLKQKIKHLVVLRQATIDAPNEAARVKANATFLGFLRDALQHNESFNTSFDTIPQLADLRSGDGYFRMINWNLPFDNQTNRYYCFVQYFDKKENITKLVELKRGYRDLEGEHRKVYSDRDWYGCLYYNIVPSKKGKKRKRAYMLLGWDGKDAYTSLKVIEVMTITNRGLRFGTDIFDYPYENNIRRFILQYKADASVSLGYDERKKQFVFNKLVPMQADLQGKYAFYIPLLEFSGFEWKRGKWTFVEDIDLKGGSRDRIYVDPPLPQKIK